MCVLMITHRSYLGKTIGYMCVCVCSNINTLVFTYRAIRLLIIGRIVRVFYWSRVVREHKGITRFFRKKVLLGQCTSCDT